LANYRQQSQNLEEVVEAMKTASRAAAQSQNPPHPASKWIEIQRINTVSDLITWLSLGLTERTADSNWIATFTISVERILNIAPRRSEHIACSAGNPVLSAGEMTIDGQYRITEISNQSTGFCPEPESWQIVESTLNQIGLQHPGEFTNPMIFRCCPNCNECNIVKDAWYVCMICGAKLPEKWNFT
ncbi:MAG: hypothetical protein F6K16_40630, partial [Symploca sp. SIO2B6]|nr:hypothetical protein [Symploca sp. SIO2B6]